MSNFEHLNNLKKFSKKSLTKKFTIIIQTLFIFSCLISIINCQDNTQKNEEQSKSNLVAGMGQGTLTVIIFIIIGIGICILGLAFSSPGLFVLIGVAVPLLVFIICIALPTGDDKSEEESIYDNKNRDNFVVARYVHFIVMLLFFCGLLGPVFIKSNITVLPQRVNSNTNKDIYDDKYLEDLEKQKKRKYNLENESLDEEEKLPLSSNKKKKNAFIRIDKDSENNINKNLLDNNLDEDNELPIAKVRKKDELNENRSKFKKFKRIQDPS